MKAPLPAPEATALAVRAQVTKQSSLRILFVDDEDALRRVVPMALNRGGHSVTVASDGLEALELFEAGKFDLVLTDLTMPRMTGDQLAKAIKEIAPDQPVMILTGFAGALLKKGPMPAFVDSMVNKPLTAQQLSSAIDAVLSSSRTLEGVGLQ